MTRGNQVVVDPRNYDRFTPIQEAASSIDARSAGTPVPVVQAAAADRACDELGNQEPIDRAVERALVALLAVPAMDGDIRVEQTGEGIGYQYVDARLEGVDRCAETVAAHGREQHPSHPGAAAYVRDDDRDPLPQGELNKTRLEAFSDGVIAILITIMVLELRIPKGNGLGTRCAIVPVFLTYVLSFVMLGIYWNNHHHLIHAAERITRRHPVGEPAPAVLAVADAVCHRLDGTRTTSRRCRPPCTEGCCC